MGELKPNMAANIRKIRDVFLHGWDPIGIGNVADWPQDEYDSYVMPVYSILRQRKGEAALLDYLVRVHYHINGTTIAREKLREVAAKFLQIDVSQDEIHR
jgi:hypothetical protein